MPDTFICAMCDGVFDKDWTDDEAQREADAIFGAALGDDPAVICDDCFLKLGLPAHDNNLSGEHT